MVKDYTAHEVIIYAYLLELIILTRKLVLMFLSCSVQPRQVIFNDKSTRIINFMKYAGEIISRVRVQIVGPLKSSASGLELGWTSKISAHVLLSPLHFPG
jgi:hypothetical protein